MDSARCPPAGPGSMQSLLVGAEEGPQVTAVSLGRTSCHAGVPNGQQHPKGPPWCRRTGRLGVKGLLRGGCSWLPGSHRKGVCGLGGAGLRVPKAAKDKGSFLCGHEPPPLPVIGSRSPPGGLAPFSCPFLCGRWCCPGGFAQGGRWRDSPAAPRSPRRGSVCTQPRSSLLSAVLTRRPVALVM